MATRRRLSKHFTVEEFDCRDGSKVKPSEYDGLARLCRVYLEPMRAQFGPVRINSGYRTARYNASIGGASKSYHVYDIHDSNDHAVDIRPRNGTPRQWMNKAMMIRKNKMGGRGGLGLYSSFIHIDTRDYASNWRG